MSTTSLGSGIPWPNPLMIDPVNDPVTLQGFTAGATGANRMNCILNGAGNYVANWDTGYFGKPGDRYEVQLVLQNTDESNPHDLFVEHQDTDTIGTQIGTPMDAGVDGTFATKRFTVPAGATVILGPFSEDGQWSTRTGTVSEQGGASTSIVSLLTFHMSDAQLQVAVMARPIGRAFGIYPDTV